MGRSRDDRRSCFARRVFVALDASSGVEGTPTRRPSGDVGPGDELRTLGSPGADDELSAPIRAHGRTIGALVVSGPLAGAAFSDGERAALADLARVAGSTLEKRRARMTRGASPSRRPSG